MTVQTDATVRHEVVVDLPQEQAFWKFADFDKIKPRLHNMLAVPICRWSPMLTFDPPHTIAFSWDIRPDWQVTSDLHLASEVQITYASEDAHRTRVILVHRHIDRHGEGWESLQAGLDAPDGWPLYLGRYEALTRDELAS